MILKLLTVCLLFIITIVGTPAMVKAQAAIGISYHSLFTTTESDFTGYEHSSKRAMESASQNGNLLKLNSSLAWNHRNAIFASISYSNLNARAVSSYREYINVGGELYNGEIEFLTDYEIESLGFAVGNRFQAIDNLFFLGGLQLNYALNDKYYQKEYIKYPADRGVFLQTGSRSKNEFTGNLADISKTYLSGILAASYKLQLSRDNKLFVDLSITYAHQLTSISTNYDIQVHNFQIGIGLSYYFSGSQQKYINFGESELPNGSKTRLSISAVNESGSPIDELIINAKSPNSKPDEIFFRPVVLTEGEIVNWKLVLTFAGKELKVLENVGYPPAEISVTLNIKEIQSILDNPDNQNTGLEYFLEVIDENSQIKQSEKGKIKVKNE